MALGGGTFLTQNKILPGAYMNFVSAASASATLSDRGYAAMGLELDWGVEGAVFEVTAADLQKNSLKIFGYAYDSDKLKGLRDLFLNIHTLYAYRLNGGGVKATCTYATAKYAGTRGNDLKIKIAANVDDNTKWDVTTILGTLVVDVQTVASAAGLVANDYVTFKTDATLAATAGTALEGGTNATVTGTQHQAALDAFESKSFNALGCVSTTDAIKGLYTAFTARLRDEVGKKFQCVVYNKAADYEGVVNVMNKCVDGFYMDDSTPVYPNEAAAVYFVTGIIAGTAVNKSATNKKYNGEYDIDVNYTQSQLEAAIKAGKFAFHQVDNDVRILEDINSLTTTTDVKGDIFKDNQTIRVIDQIANDIAVLFNTKYLGAVPNDNAGRISLWSDIVKHHQQLNDIRAIEGFVADDVTVAQGDTKKAVVVSDAITVVNAMVRLYMTVTVA